LSQAEHTALDPAPTHPASTPLAEPALRDAVLAGRFFGATRTAEAGEVAEFPSLADGAALALWFGAEHAHHLSTEPDALRGALDRDIAAIDALIAEQLDAVLHAERLRRFEGRWRGLAWLVDRTETGPRLKIKLLSVTWNDICRDLDRAIEFDQSLMFQKIYEAEFGSPGGEPYGLMVIDHEVRHHPGRGAPTDDVSALAALAGVAAAAFCPMILSASPALLGLDSFADLATVSDPAAAFREDTHARWRSLSGKADTRFLCVALPRLLARPPWGDDPARPDGFRYREFAPSTNERVWMSAAFAFAAVVARAFARNAWPADVRGSETDRVGAGLVDGLPVERFDTDPDNVWTRHALEVLLTDRQERLLVDAGLMPVTALPFGPEALFASVRSLQAPARHIGANAAAADANARLSSQINSMLCASRFAHYLKVMGREMVGSFRTADEIERELQNWLTGYVNASTSGNSESRARYPLVGGRVMVKEQPGRPGVFGCTVHLQPHFQLDDVSATFQLVTEIVGRERQ
jgi:type VI secretion system ImpC/EvpB family protein